MSTAHRPTWAPAKGGEGQGGMRVYAPTRQMSAKDQAAQMTLKFRCVWGRRSAWLASSALAVHVSSSLVCAKLP